MIYVLYGENDYEINSYINNIIKKNNIEDKITYDYTETEIEDILEEASYNDLFGSKKIIIVTDSNFLTSKSTLENKSFDNYIQNQNENTILVFKAITDKLDERKKIVKTLKEIATFKEFKLLEEKDMNSYIKNYFSNLGFEIDFKAINEIIKRININTSLLHNELEKLYLYKIDDKKIELEDVKKVITNYPEDETFKLVEAVINKDKGKIFKIYKSLIENKSEPTAIIVLIANQFRLILQSSILFKDGLNNNQIAGKLKEHPYRVQLALESSYKISRKELIKYLRELAILDLKIKTGEIEKVRGLETFFLEL